MKILALAVLVCPLAACQANSEEVTTAKSLVSDMLNDPSSAQWKNIDQSGPCTRGEVNAKNSFGGYVGFRPFYYNSATKEAGLSPGDPSNAEIAAGLLERSNQQIKYIADESKCIEASTAYLKKTNGIK